MRMVTATVIAVSVLGVCAAWCCGRDAGWKQAADTLAAILVDDPPTRYFLSVRAMDGILSRASRRGKQLPELLVTAIAGMKEWWRQNPLGGGMTPPTP